MVGCKTSSDPKKDIAPMILNQKYNSLSKPEPKNDFALMMLNEKFESLSESEKKSYFISYGSLSQPDCEKKLIDETHSLIQDPKLVTTDFGKKYIESLEDMTPQIKSLMDANVRQYCKSFISGYNSAYKKQV